MRLFDKFSGWLVPPQLTRSRIWFAFAVAGLTDALQFLLGFVGWLGFDEVLDVIAMLLITASIGFHLLLLPTFALEMLPVTDMLPTWTGCTAAVVLLRRAAPPQPPSQAPPLPTKMANVSPPVINETKPPVTVDVPTEK